MCLLAARLLLLLPYYYHFFYYEKVSPSCLFIRFLFDFFSTLNFKSGEKSEISVTLKSALFFAMTHTCMHIFYFLCFSQRNNLCVVCFPNLARFILFCIHFVCYNFSPYFHDPLEPVLFLGYDTAYPMYETLLSHFVYVVVFDTND